MATYIDTLLRLRVQQMRDSTDLYLIKRRGRKLSDHFYALLGDWGIEKTKFEAAGSHEPAVKIDEAIWMLQKALQYLDPVAKATTPEQARRSMVYVRRMFASAIRLVFEARLRHQL